MVELGNLFPNGTLQDRDHRRLCDLDGENVLVIVAIHPTTDSCQGCGSFGHCHVGAFFKLRMPVGGLIK